MLTCFWTMWHVCVSHYSLGSMIMSLRSLQIFSQEWGSKHKFEMKMWPFEWNYIPFFIHGSVVCFLLPKCVYFFTNGVYRKLFPVLFITTICVYDFCETVLVNKNTPCQGMIWIFPSTMLYFYTGFWWYCTNSLVSLEMPKNKWRGRCCPRAPARTYAPWTLQTSVLKKRPPCQLIFVVYTSPEVYFIDTVC